MQVQFVLEKDNNYDNWYIVFPTGDKVQVRMSFLNRKFIYKVSKIYEEQSKVKK